MPLDPQQVHAPEIGPLWLNSAPLSMRGLRGKVVLINFWDYTCVNCIRTLPYLREWHRRYRDDGLAVIGVHTPEFSFMRLPENVERAARKFGLDYPILLDNDRQVWHAFANRSWPAEYLVDKAGYIRYSHAGEGHYRETEQAIQELLSDIDPKLAFPALFPPVRAMDQPGAHRLCQPATPELHLGETSGRHLELMGAWSPRTECLESGTEPAGLRLSYSAAEVNAVMAPAAAGRAVVQVFDNGLALDHQSRGEDVREAPDGGTYVEVDWPRMYSLVRRDRFLSRVLELSTRAPGLQLYAFSFVSCVPQ